MAHLNKVAVWERQDGGISITYFDTRDMRSGESEDNFITRHTNLLKLNVPVLGAAVMSIIKKEDIPQDRSNRDEWSLKNGKVVVDPIKLAAKQANEAAKQAIFAKIGITKEEFENLK